MLNFETCSKARLSRDPRFDGVFFTAVKTTKIYCRSICPATTPKEENVTYFSSAVNAANAGYRPCLRCRPDSAPDSPAWKGVSTTLERAIRLIDEGALQTGSLCKLAERLGISDRYLRQLFKQNMGVSPKHYALYQQCLFAKKLLHETQLPITQIALASGFKSIRRFNDCFQSLLKLTPSQVRKKKTEKSSLLNVYLSYRPPYDWHSMRQFLANRAISNLEWYTPKSYGRTFEWFGVTGFFLAEHEDERNRFMVSIQLDDVRYLKSIINNIRRVLDLDVDILSVEKDLQCSLPKTQLKTGLRLPGIWNVFEAGVRAILGQQVTVVAAHHLVSYLVNELGEEIADKRVFPQPQAIIDSDLNGLKVPNSRKKTLWNLAQHYIDHPHPNEPDEWLSLKGIGPWTINYAKLRGLSDPNIFLGGDLGVKKSMEALGYEVNPELASPWKSYLTMHLWSRL